MDQLIRVTPQERRQRPASAPLLLCDRDGVIIENLHTDVRRKSDVTLLDGAPEALHTAARRGFAIAVVSNQAVIGRGGITREQAVAVHEHMLSLLAAHGVTVDLSLLCPHRPEDGCGCRKPAPGMVHTALAEFGAAPERSVLIGDALEDMLAATRAGVRGLHVRTGRGAAHRPLVLDHPETAHVPSFPSIVEAVATEAVL